MNNPGRVGLLGSGETTATGGQLFEAIAKNYTAPISACVLETPAGFEQNSTIVAARVTDYIKVRLQNYSPKIIQLPARKRGYEGGLDNPELLWPIMAQNMIFFGPGSPSYTVRQLEGSLAWKAIEAAHESGAAIIAASAASIALGKYALPVYEIYKVGEDPFWKPGLNFFGKYNLNISIIPHWNNEEGGAALDTSCCFMGQARFAKLMQLLPSEVVIVGIDEHTGLIIDFVNQRCNVTGKGAIHLMINGKEEIYGKSEHFPIQRLGAFYWPQEVSSLPAEFQAFVKKMPLQKEFVEHVPVEIDDLVKLREIARQQKNWPESDRIRDLLANKGWLITDTKDGPTILNDQQN